MDGPAYVLASVAQVVAIARLAESEQLGPKEWTTMLLQEGNRVHVLASLPAPDRPRFDFTWISIDQSGEIVGRRPAARAEMHTLTLRRSPFHAGLRRLLRERGIDPEDVILADSFDDDVDESVGVLILPDGTAKHFRHRYLEEEPDRDELLEWCDAADVSDRTFVELWEPAIEKGRALLEHGFLRGHPTRG